MKVLAQFETIGYLRETQDTRHDTPRFTLPTASAQSARSYHNITMARFYFHVMAGELGLIPDTPKVAPRLQASLDRKAEGLRRYAEKEKAAALAEKEQAEQLRIRIASTGPEAAMARAPHDDAEKERAARAKKRAQREARRRSELYATEARWSSNPVRLHGPE